MQYCSIMINCRTETLEREHHAVKVYASLIIKCLTGPEVHSPIKCDQL